MSQQVTPSTPPHSNEPSELLSWAIDQAQQQIRWSDLVKAITGAAAITLGYLFVFVLLDHHLPHGMPLWGRWVGLISYLAVISTWLVTQLIPPLFHRVSPLYVAKNFEDSLPELRGFLITVVQLWSNAPRRMRAVWRAIVGRAEYQLKDVDVAQIIDQTPLLRTGYALLITVALFCLYIVLAPKRVGPSLMRVFPTVSSPVPTKTEIREVQPGDTRILAHSEMEVTVDLRGTIPQQVVLLYSTTDLKYQNEQILLEQDENDPYRFRGVLHGESGQGLMRDFEYHIEAGDARSHLYRVTVHAPPSSKVLSVDVVPPSYTGLAGFQVEGGSFTAVEGSRVRISGEATVPLKSARVQFLQDVDSPPTGEEEYAQVHDRRITSEWIADTRQDGTYPQYYRLFIVSQDGHTEPNPVTYHYTLIIDQPPEIAWVFPDEDLEVPANAVLPLVVRARDPDYRLSNLVLKAERAGKTIDSRQVYLGNDREVQVEYEWSLDSLRLQPGEEVSFYIVAEDNKEPNRNRRASASRRLKIQSPVAPADANRLLAEAKKHVHEHERQAQDAEQGQQDRNHPHSAPSSESLPNTQVPTSLPSPADSTPAQSSSPQLISPVDSTSRNDERSNPPLDPHGEDDAEVLRKLQELLGTQPQTPGSQAESTQNAPPSDAQSSGGTPEDSHSSKPLPSASSENRSPSPQMMSRERESSSDPKSTQNQRDERSAGTQASPPIEHQALGAPPQTQPVSQSGNVGQRSAREQEAGSSHAQSTDSVPQPSERASSQQTSRNVGDQSMAPASSSSATSKSTSEREGQEQPTSSKDDSSTKNEAGYRDSHESMPSNQMSPQAPESPDPNSNRSQSFPTDSQERSASSSGGDKPQHKNDKSRDMPTGQQQSPAQSSTPAEEQASGQEMLADQHPEKREPSTDSTQQTGREPADKQTNQKTSPPMESASDCPHCQNGQCDQHGSGGGSSQRGQSSSRSGAESTAGSSVPSGSSPASSSSSSTSNSPDGQHELGRSGSSLSNTPDVSSQGSESAPRSTSSPTASSSSDTPGKASSSTGSSSAQGRDHGQSAGSPEGAHGKDSSGQRRTSHQTGETDSAAESPSNTPQGTRMSPDDRRSSSSSSDLSNSAENSRTPQSNQRSTPEATASAQSPNQDSADSKQSSASAGDPSNPAAPAGSQRSQQSTAPKSNPAERATSGKHGSPPQLNSQPNSSSAFESTSPEGAESAGLGSQQDGQQPTQQPGAASTARSNVGQGGNISNAPPRPMQGDHEATATNDGEAPNLEFNRQAVELTLKQLNEQFERGDVSPDILKELGWTADELKRFVERMSRLIEAQRDQDPQVAEAAKNQFEEMLKTLSLQRTNAQRIGKRQPRRDTEVKQGLQSNPPKDVEKAWEYYTRKILGQQPPSQPMQPSPVPR